MDFCWQGNVSDFSYAVYLLSLEIQTLFPTWASLLAQLIICLPCRRPGFHPWVGKIPWRRERLHTPVFWPGEFHGLYSPWGHKELDMTEPLVLSYLPAELSCDNSDFINALWSMKIWPFIITVAPETVSGRPQCWSISTALYPRQNPHWAPPTRMAISIVRGALPPSLGEQPYPRSQQPSTQCSFALSEEWATVIPSQFMTEMLSPQSCEPDQGILSTQV